MHASYYAHLAWLLPAPDTFRHDLDQALVATDPDAKALCHLTKHYLNESELHKLGRAFVKKRQTSPLGAALTQFRLGLLSNNTVDHLLPALIATALRYGLTLEVMSFSYDVFLTAAMARHNELADFNPDAVLVAVDYEGLPLRDAFGDEEEEHKLINACTSFLQTIYDGVRSHYHCLCLAQSIALPTLATFGQSERKVYGSLTRVINEVNNFIASRADALIDVATLASTVGTAQWFDNKLMQLGQIPFALTYVPLYTDHVCRVLAALRGKSRRVLVLDLDNTLWSGVVGDDGVEGILIGNDTPTGKAYLAFQRKVLALRQRGILLAVSSKNDDHVARRAFREVPSMVLKEDSFAAFQANWNDKAANIEAIAATLSLGLDSFVFVDDNPVERALVRQFLPQVAVPEMPDDPAYFSQALDAAGYFETTSFSQEDARRADLYRSKATSAQLAPKDLTTYLASLEMRLVCSNVTPQNRARVVQLINKSNQFNLTTRRLTESQIKTMEQDKRFHIFALQLADKFDDHGIISILIAEQSKDDFIVHSWVMSCRVIGRGVEKAALAFLIEKAHSLKCHTMRGEYIPSSRNQMVENHYAQLGFVKEKDVSEGKTSWSLALGGIKSASNQPLRVIDETKAAL